MIEVMIVRDVQRLTVAALTDPKDTVVARVAVGHVGQKRAPVAQLDGIEPGDRNFDGHVVECRRR